MNFALDVSRMVANVTEETERVVRGTLYGVASRVIRGTPVAAPEEWLKPDPTYIGGTLRGGWNASIGSPDLAKKATKDQSGDSTVLAMSVVVNSLELGQTFYLTNPYPYAMAIEYGWSKQARNPNGMLRIAIADTQAVINAL